MPDKRTYKDRREQNIAAVLKRRAKIRAALLEHKGGKCEFCGYNKCEAALEFHHIDPSTKLFGLSGSTKALKTQLKEADKCYLLCANCHREIHNGV